MNIKLAVLTAAYALLSIGSVAAQDKAESKPTADTAKAAGQTAPNPVSSFGSGFNVGPGGGSASSLAGGFSSPSSGVGSQTFGGGFTGSGPLSTPVRGAGG